MDFLESQMPASMRWAFVFLRGTDPVHWCQQVAHGALEDQLPVQRNGFSPLNQIFHQSYSQGANYTPIGTGNSKTK